MKGDNRLAIINKVWGAGAVGHRKFHVVVDMSMLGDGHHPHPTAFYYEDPALAPLSPKRPISMADIECASQDINWLMGVVAEQRERIRRLTQQQQQPDDGKQDMTIAYGYGAASAFPTPPPPHWKDDVKINYKSKIMLGQKYMDKDTGLVGTATSLHFYKNACERVVLQYLHDGDIKEASFDAVDLEPVDTPIPAEKMNRIEEEINTAKPGGPARSMPKSR